MTPSNYGKTIPSEAELAIINRVFTRPRRSRLIEFRGALSKSGAPGRSRCPEQGTVYEMDTVYAFTDRALGTAFTGALKEALEAGLPFKTLVCCDLQIPMSNQPIMLAPGIKR